MFGLLPKRPGLDAGTVAGNVCLGDVSGTLIQNFNQGTPPAEPSLPWRDLPAQPDVFRLLSWRTRLVRRLIGRDAERAELLGWARQASNQPAVRLLTGPGGSGKSRLAAEVAGALRAEGWTAGFARLDQPSILPLAKAGLFLVVDYPEERPAETLALLRSLAALETPPAPTRLLLLSRRSFDWWQDTIDEAHAAGICDSQAVGVANLDEEGTVSLFREAVQALSSHLGREPGEAGDRAVRSWWAGDPARHGLPLFATAAAIHGVLEPGRKLGVEGGEVIQALARREIGRINNEGKSAGLGRQSAGRLAALAVVRGQLDAAMIRRLAEPKLELGLPPADRAGDAVTRLSYWEDGAFPAPAPDIVAAAFSLEVFAKRADLVPEWLWAVLEDNPHSWVDRVNRVGYDISVVHEPAEQRMSGWLAEMVNRNPERAETLAFVVDNFSPPTTLQLAVNVSRALLAAGELDDTERTRTLNGLSIHLSNAGDGAGALEAIREAVEIHRRLAAQNPAWYEPALALILNNLSNHLSEAGDGAGALAAIRESVEIRRRLLAQNPARYEPDLALSLNSLSNHLSEAGDGAGALAAIRESVEIYRRLAAQNPARYEPDLAMSLNNLSLRLSEAGDGAGALAAIREAVEIRRRLAAQNPARYEPDLALSLNNLSVHLSNAGEGAGALAAIRQAVEIRRRLAAQNPARYEPYLAMSLNNLSAYLSDAGDGAGALVASREAVETHRRLAAQTPARYEPDLAGSLNNLSLRLNDAGDAAGELAASREAVEIYRRLAAQNPARYEPDLALSLNNLSNSLSNAGEGAGALAAIREVVEIRRRLAAQIPARFRPLLAKSLTILGILLRKSGDTEQADAAEREARQLTTQPNEPDEPAAPQSQ